MTINLILALILATSAQGEETGLIEELDASSPRTGYVTLSMSPAQVLGAEAAAQINHMLLANELIEWRAYVPRNYSANNPPGVMVFVPSIDWAGVPDEWQSLMDEQNLIWIGASFTGNSAPVQERILKAMFAPRAVSDHYKVNTDRVYVAGFAGGGKVANLVQSADPVTFKGGMYICGALFWGERTPPKIDTMRANRHVFIRGCFDPKEREVINVYKAYLDAGIEQADLITVQTRRRAIPKPRYIESAIRYLDGDAASTADEN